MSISDDKQPKMPDLDAIDQSKRETLKRIAYGTAYAIPVVATFSLNGMMINSVAAAVNSTAS